MDLFDLGEYVEAITAWRDAGAKLSQREDAGERVRTAEWDDSDAKGLDLPKAGPGVPCACKRGRRLAELHQAARGCEVDHPDDEPLPPYGGAVASRFNPLQLGTLAHAAADVTTGEVCTL
ncbi:hypothetical protein [Microbispora bryophytorum]|uniref:hypothetical protein n=1 Tax=Microbispora bryophytorum TaxID=1460882 RepID=UPI0033C23818